MGNVNRNPKARRLEEGLNVHSANPSKILGRLFSKSAYTKFWYVLYSLVQHITYLSLISGYVALCVLIIYSMFNAVLIKQIIGVLLIIFMSTYVNQRSPTV